MYSMWYWIYRCCVEWLCGRLYFVGCTKRRRVTSKYYSRQNYIAVWDVWCTFVKYTIFNAPSWICCVIFKHYMFVFFTWICYYIYFTMTVCSVQIIRLMFLFFVCISICTWLVTRIVRLQHSRCIYERFVYFHFYALYKHEWEFATVRVYLFRSARVPSSVWRTYAFHFMCM